VIFLFFFVCCCEYLQKNNSRREKEEKTGETRQKTRISFLVLFKKVRVWLVDQFTQNKVDFVMRKFL